jgi:hypothetical protein
LAEVPLIRVHAPQAEAAWEAHQALLRAEREQPSLRFNPAWIVLRADAYAQFEIAFERPE